MFKNKIKLKIEKSSIPFLYLILVVPLLIAILAQFKVIALTQYVPAVITIFTAMFVTSEIGFVGMIRRKKLGKDTVRIFGILVVLAAMILAALSMFVTMSPVLSGVQGVVNIFLVLYVVIEGFR